MRGTLALFACFIAGPSVAETRLDLYSGRILCTISEVCPFGAGCSPNTQYLRSFVLDFDKSGGVFVEIGIHERTEAIVLSDRPTSDSLNWWNLAWMSSGPNILQIGFDHKFSWIEGSQTLIGFDGSPPTLRLGKCEI